MSQPTVYFTLTALRLRTN